MASSIPLGSGWRYAIAKRLNGAAPRVPWGRHQRRGHAVQCDDRAAGEDARRGIAWYQGEIGYRHSGYDRRLAALFADWRTRLGSPQAAWGVVQRCRPTGPSPQRRAKAAGARCAMRNAGRRARRTARASRCRTISAIRSISTPARSMPWVSSARPRHARHRLQGRDRRVGPAIATARASGTGVALRFTGVTGALHARGARTGDRLRTVWRWGRARCSLCRGHGG